MSYRIKQFFWALTAKVNEEEKLFVNQYLNDEERQLFNKLKVYEQKHSIRVAKGMGQIEDETLKNDRIKLGLLHDIGKTVYPIGPIKKSVMVLLHQISKGKIEKLQGMNMVKCYYQHPQLGYTLLLERGYTNEAMLNTIRDHHKKVKDLTNKDLIDLQKWDNLY